VPKITNDTAILPMAQQLTGYIFPLSAAYRHKLLPVSVLSG
jgi:hypothetical protein